MPFLLFAYREVPHVSTGFSPFELLYARSVRGPPSILREVWTEDESDESGVVQYIIQMRDKLSTMIELAVENKPQAMRSVVKTEIEKMLSSGITEPANSPIVLIKKSDKSWRFCIDYINFNSKTIFDAHPMPRVDEVMEGVGRTPYISTLDLSKGYW